MNKRIRKKKEKQAEAAMAELGLALHSEEAFRAALEKITKVLEAVTEALEAVTEALRRWREQKEAENGKAADGEGGR